MNNRYQATTIQDCFIRNETATLKHLTVKKWNAKTIIDQVGECLPKRIATTRPGEKMNRMMEA
jgi:hypothetical protein